jgi:hypothetical protein
MGITRLSSTINSSVKKISYARNQFVPVELLLVGGGGAGKSGGGGAGGVLYYGSESAVTSGSKVANGSALNLNNGTYNITIGLGGQGGTLQKGGDTIMQGDSFCLISYGGGCSQNTDTAGPNLDQTGGSGGGGGRTSTALPTFGGKGYPGQGYNGGTVTQNAYPYPGGGGGGAGAVGAANSGGSSGSGGVGVGYSISGSLTYYAGGGGGGGGDDGSLGGPSIGYATTAGARNSTSGESGAANTGSGGGGQGGGGTSGGSGGSGVAIIRHLNTYPTASTTGTVSVSNSGGYIVYRFTGNGTVTF